MPCCYVWVGICLSWGLHGLLLCPYWWELRVRDLSVEQLEVVTARFGVSLAIHQLQKLSGHLVGFWTIQPSEFHVPIKQVKIVSRPMLSNVVATSQN